MNVGSCRKGALEGRWPGSGREGAEDMRKGCRAMSVDGGGVGRGAGHLSVIRLRFQGLGYVALRLGLRLQSSQPTGSVSRRLGNSWVSLAN